MKIRKYKIPTWFITEELHHKVSISYDEETKRAYKLLDIMSDKYWKIDRRRKFNRIEVTEEEYQTWYVYIFLFSFFIFQNIILMMNQFIKELKNIKRLKNFQIE